MAVTLRKPGTLVPGDRLPIRHDDTTVKHDVVGVDAYPHRVRVFVSPIAPSGNPFIDYSPHERVPVIDRPAPTTNH